MSLIDAPWLTALRTNDAERQRLAEQRRAQQIKEEEAFLKEFEASVPGLRKTVTEADASAAFVMEAPRKLQRTLRWQENLRNGLRDLRQRSMEALEQAMMDSLGTFTAVAASPDHLFVASEETVGRGAAVWRLSWATGDAARILSNVGSFTADVDLQWIGDRLLVTDNDRQRISLCDEAGNRKESIYVNRWQGWLNTVGNDRQSLT